jgi:hypothetical protein
MIKSGLNYLKWAPLAAVLALAVVVSMRSSTAKNQPPVANAAVGADFVNEERVIGKYFDDLVQYQQECSQAKKRAVLRNADFEPLQRKSSDLERRLSDVQNAAREVINKLKAAHEWDGIDAKLAATVTDSRLRSFFQETSFKADLEYAAGSLSSHKGEISLPLENLRKRLAGANLTPTFSAAIVPAAYRAPAAMFGVGLSCRIGQLRLKLIEKNGGNLNGGNACNAVFCACGKAPPCGTFECPGTGATQ